MAEASVSSSAATTAATTTSPPETSVKKRLRARKQKQKESKMTVDNDSQLVEADNVFVSGCDISVGALIKRAAYNLHRKKQPLSCRERKIMTFGPSSFHTDTMG